MMESSPSSLGGVTLCFYGAGSMAEAILRGLGEAKLTNPANVTVMNRQNAEHLMELQRNYGVVPATTDAAKEDTLRTSDVIVLGMKPKDAASALLALKPMLRPEQLIVSLIAGLTIDSIHQLLGRSQPVVRTMPNTSSTIGLGATGICFSDAVTDEQHRVAMTMFKAVGMVTIVDETLIAAVNGVSGSGPAYVYYLMEAMIEAGVQLGLTQEAATQLTAQTVKGAAEMIQSTGESPGDLRRKVTSPNGTTQAAIETLERYSFQEGVNQAILRCVERANEMGEAIREEAVNAKQA